MKKIIKIGIIGLGARGTALLNANLLKMQDVAVCAICDTYEDRINIAKKEIESKTKQSPFTSTNYKDLLGIKEIDAIIIASGWETHMDIAIEAMHAGKYVGLEVGGAYSIEDCWSLINAYNTTKMPCMLLENCCYGRTELKILNMVKKGVFGEVVHCSGGYHHDLRKEICEGEENHHYRLQNYLSRNCENYPTHELGPIAKVLDINKGNRMVSLVSWASKAAGLKEYVSQGRCENKELANANFAQGDIVTTLIRCAGGQTITLVLDTTLPRAYSRGFSVRGTKAAYEESNNSIFIDGQHNDYDFKWKEQWGNAEGYAEVYDHPLWKEYIKGDITSGHDGIDWLVLRAFVESVKNKTQPPIDVYDAAAWMSISVLSEQSILCGGAPVAIPDFTNGAWLRKNKENIGKYSLDEICEDSTISIY